MKPLNKILSLLCAVGGLMLAVPAKSASLTTVPMQGGMVMPMIRYDAMAGRLHVMLEPDVPQLTPLRVSHPGDQFDPVDPWFGVLDPSRQGLSFSRRYGFVMDAGTDPLPAGRQIWIRKVSGSPGLGAYRYAASAPKAFEPIFGTSGVTNAMRWNGMMFHPTFTAPPGTNELEATFEAYLMDETAGVEVPGSGTGPFVLRWTNVPDGRPALAIATRVVVFWPGDTEAGVLEGAADVSEPVWTKVTNAPVLLEGQRAVVIEPGDPRKFFRLRSNP